MYNGRQRRIQTESVRDQTVKGESARGCRNGQIALRQSHKQSFFSDES